MVDIEERSQIINHLTTDVSWSILRTSVKTMLEQITVTAESVL